ncbi:hypothetical protein SSX86_008439 [Deinandra increscens subsp. villosa]|uniref:Uncharacterized protein n=1 Tax=Deinandra increscens subsp. villosa TaxID=3103831 RepID=A0AAP0DFX0_9ASTR
MMPAGHNLVNLKLDLRGLSLENLNPMPMLTSLTLKHLYLKDENLNQLNKWFPNLEVLKLLHVQGLEDPKIHLPTLKTCFWQDYYDELPSLTLITPNLITLTVECLDPPTIYIEAPMLSHFHFNAFTHADTFMVPKFENLKTLWLQAIHIGFLLSKFPFTKTVETLTLYSKYKPSREYRDPEFTLGKVFSLFPNVTSLCINSGAWFELEACLKRQGWEISDGRKEPKTTIYQCSRCLSSSGAWLESKSRWNPHGWEILDGMKSLKRICAYLMLVDPLSTFQTVACVLDQCVGLSKVSLLIHSDVTGPVLESFRCKCMDRWPELKWRWGIWTKHNKYIWITDGSSI